MIDWDRLEELQREVGEDDFTEIAALFLEELTEALETLGALTDPRELSDGYHGLKGAALNLGFTTVAKLCADAEKLPEAADLPTIRSAVSGSASELLKRHPSVAA